MGIKEIISIGDAVVTTEIPNGILGTDKAHHQKGHDDEGKT